MGSPESGARHDERLDRYWDEVVLGLPSAETGLDPTDVAAIHRLRRDVHLPGTSATFRRRLRRDLMRTASLPVSSGPSAFSLNGAWLPESGLERGSRGSRWLAQAATILILLGTAALLVVIFNRMRPHEPVVIVPAVEIPVATPASTPPPTAATPSVSQGPPVAFRWTYADPAPHSLALSPQITVAPDGTLWVVDGLHMGFQMLSPDGRLLDRWGTPGKGDGQFAFKVDAQNAQSRVAFRLDGGFYVVDAQNRRIQQFDADRAFVRTWGGFGTGDGQFVTPRDVLVATDGTVSVIDGGRNDVQQFTSEGRFLRKFGQRGSGEGELKGPSWGALDAAGNLWIADVSNNRLVQFGPDGTFLRAIGGKGTGEGEFDVPQAVAIDPAGRVYVADSQNARVQVLNSDGAFLFAVTGADVGGRALIWPVGIAVDTTGGIYVLDYAASAVVEKFQLMPDAASTPPSPAPP